MGIGEVARRAGVAASAIRYYESIGLMPRPVRTSGRRVYDATALDRLSVIRSARALGFGVREIRTLTSDTASITERWRALARRKLPELESLIGRATRMKQLLESGLHCSCVRIEDCILHDCAPPAVIPATLVRSRTAVLQTPPGTSCSKC